MSIKVKDEHASLVEKDVMDESLELSRANPILIRKIAEAVKKFDKSQDLEAPEIILKFKMKWQ